MDQYPSDIPSSTLSDLSLRRLLCNFLFCALSTTLARDSTDMETQLQNYLLVRSHATNFYDLVPLQLIRLEADSKTDLLKKYRSVLAFDFEAAGRLKAWDSLLEILDQSEDTADTKLNGIFSDVILCSEAPVATKGFLLMVREPAQRILTSYSRPPELI